MINVSNKPQMTRNERIKSLDRSLLTQPYYLLVEVPIADAGSGIVNGVYNQSSDSLGRDFFITDVQSNIGELQIAGAGAGGVNILASGNTSLYGFVPNAPLIPALYAYEARVPRQASFPTRFLYTDRQWEYPSFHLKYNDRLTVQVINNSTVPPVTFDVALRVVFKGYTLLNDRPYLTQIEQDQLTVSLDQELKYEYFNVVVTDEDKDRDENQFTLTNDYIPREILAVGVVDTTDTLADVSNMLITVKDLSRRLTWGSPNIPLEYIAPRMNIVKDELMYWLPIEYYWPPLGKLAFNIDNIWPNNNGAGAEIVVLTRNV